MMFLPVFIIWIFLILGIISAFCRHRIFTFALLFFALISALIFNVISPFILLIYLLLLSLAYQTPKLPFLWKAISQTVLVGFSIGLMAHMIPGFHSIKLLDQVFAGEKSIGFNLYLNLDKPLLFFLLWLGFPNLLGTNGHFNAISRGNFYKCIAIILFTPLILCLALLTGVIKLEFGLPHWWWIFVINNLFLTCVAEEALFRGVLQQFLKQHLGLIWGLGITSLLFGVAHIAGGWALILFASMAGLSYGIVFHLSQRLWVAILGHFFLNFMHLLLFTYPIAAN